eukprot:4673942-Pyramimonas_sp.AAC.1
MGVQQHRRAVEGREGWGESTVERNGAQRPVKGSAAGGRLQSTVARVGTRRLSVQTPWRGSRMDSSRARHALACAQSLGAIWGRARGLEARGNNARLVAARGKMR